MLVSSYSTWYISFVNVKISLSKTNVTVVKKQYTKLEIKFYCSFIIRQRWFKHIGYLSWFYSGVRLLSLDCLVNPKPKTMLGRLSFQKRFWQKQCSTIARSNSFLEEIQLFNRRKLYQNCSILTNFSNFLIFKIGRPYRNILYNNNF